MVSSERILSFQTCEHGGFFHICHMKLCSIIRFILHNHSLPYHINDNETLHIFKENNKSKNSYSVSFYFFEDLNSNKIQEYELTDTFKYFLLNINNFNLEGLEQFTEYNSFPYCKYKFLTKLYFNPSQSVKNKIQMLEYKYLIDYKNTCVLFHRGNDKKIETNICSFDQKYEKALEILKKNSKIQFLIQSDETEFINFMICKFPNNSFYFQDEIMHVSNNYCGEHYGGLVPDVFRCYKDIEKRIYYTQYFFAIMKIMSRCEYIICSSGNCDFWIIMLRGNSQNVFQFLNDKWIL